MPSASMKASVTSLATTTSRNGPNGTGAGRPKRSTKRSVATRLSFEWTMVWFSLMVMDGDTTAHALEVSTEQGALRRWSWSGHFPGAGLGGRAACESLRIAIHRLREDART